MKEKNSVNNEKLSKLPVRVKLSNEDSLILEQLKSTSKNASDIFRDALAFASDNLEMFKKYVVKRHAGPGEIAIDPYDDHSNVLSNLINTVTDELRCRIVFTLPESKIILDKGTTGLSIQNGFFYAAFSYNTVRKTAPKAEIYIDLKDVETVMLVNGLTGEESANLPISPESMAETEYLEFKVRCFQ